MATRIVIHHLGGSKVNQVEQFPLDNFSELTIGRETGMTIAFDPMRDDAVSRRHAAIKINAGDPPSFKLSDLGSSNGTLVNGQRVIGETELLPGDTIELGTGGPKFTFDLDPRPMLPARTRMMPAMGGAGSSGPSTATRMIDTSGPIPTPTSTLPPTDEIRPAIGRNTVMRMLTEQRQSHARIGMYALAGILIVVGVVGGVLYHKSQVDAAAAQAAAKAQADKVLAKTEAQRQEDLKKAQEAHEMTPQELMTAYGNSTVYISMQWRLYDRETGKPLFHRTVPDPNGGPDLPAYVQLGDGKIYRWLTTDDEENTNRKVGAAGSGTGFVVNDQGLIFTNKHVAAGWKINYNQFASYERGRGYLFQAQKNFFNDSDRRPLCGRNGERPVDPRTRQEVPCSNTGYEAHAQWNQAHADTQGVFSLNEGKFRSLVSWQPEDGGPVFANKQPVVIGNGHNVFEGRDEQLLVRFPGSRLDITARLIRASDDADAAVIKIDPTEKLKPIPVAQDDIVNIGQTVTVLGYPGFSEKNYGVTVTRENGETRKQLSDIPEPTVTTGIISNISLPTQQAGNTTIISTMGHVYQMSLPSGAGNSGGPVFDTKGRVIGLFTYGNRSNETVTYAVPIQYARNLLAMQRQ